MNNSKQLIIDIYQSVWMYNTVHDKYEDWPTPLSEDTAEIAPIIKNYCETIIRAKTEKSKIVKDAIENIYKYARPENYMESTMNKLYPQYSDYIAECPKGKAHNILDSINELISANKSENDISLQELNDKWKHKWIYFNGDEDGQQIIRINKIHYISAGYYDNDQLAFDGSMINFLNGNNSSEGDGVAIKEVENMPVECLHYIEYISEPYDYEANDDEEYSDDWHDPKKLDAAFSSEPIDTDLKSRILTDDEVNEMIKDAFFDRHYGAIKQNCYDR